MLFHVSSLCSSPLDTISSSARDAGGISDIYDSNADIKSSSSSDDEFAVAIAMRTSSDLLTITQVQ